VLLGLGSLGVMDANAECSFHNVPYFPLSYLMGLALIGRL